MTDEQQPERMGPWIATYGGRHFHPLDPRPEDIDLVDIAHALGNLCRFTGHTREFYSVAQHSVLVSQSLSGESLDVQLWGLLHDAAEAYIGDISKPLKDWMFFSPPEGHPQEGETRNVRDIEELILQAIAERFWLPVGPDDWDVGQFRNVLAADARALATERRDLIDDDAVWNIKAEPWPSPIRPWGPKSSEVVFLGRAAELGIEPVVE